MKTRTCTKCGAQKDISDFFRDARLRDGLQRRCKPCMRAATADGIKRNPEARRAREKRRRILRPKRSTAYVRQWRLDNPERSKALNAPSDARRAADRARYRGDPKRKTEVLRRLKELNQRRPEIKVAIVAKRRALRKFALANWASNAKIHAIYAEARRLTIETGIKHEVDHVVPLQSRIVCGLHVENNLRAIPRMTNLSKGNRVWPDMP